MYKLAQSTDSGEMTALKIRNHIIYNWMVAEKGFDDKFDQNNKEFLDKILESSLTIINAETSPLSESDKIHWLLNLTSLTDSPKLIKVVENVIKNSNFENWTNECAIDAFMLISKIHNTLPIQYEEILSQISSKNRVYNIEELRSLVVFINKNKDMYDDKPMVSSNSSLEANSSSKTLLQETAQKLYEFNLSSIMSRADVATLHHFISFWKIFQIDLQKHYQSRNTDFHAKFSKIAMKRLNRLASPKNDSLDGKEAANGQSEGDSANLELLKLLDVFGKG